MTKIAVEKCKKKSRNALIGDSDQETLRNAWLELEGVIADLCGLVDVLQGSLPASIVERSVLRLSNIGTAINEAELELNP